ncbi:hypothetical protein DM02DRAFT_665710 [Periconia macrospinosa]|uniref:Uncharacterized protein n=1 Tax=Periconia macrospinosa TaxID=97972 RepID=A0A2V1EG97_9PLEO|nr:hypothetical protein DM02DRAFT_665710 [Periconia macrospinosa]
MSHTRVPGVQVKMISTSRAVDSDAKFQELAQQLRLIEQECAEKQKETEERLQKLEEQHEKLVQLAQQLQEKWAAVEQDVNAMYSARLRMKSFKARAFED